MKRSSSAQGSRKKKPTPAQIRRHIAKLVDAYQIEWNLELGSNAGPNWARFAFTFRWSNSKGWRRA